MDFNELRFIFHLHLSGVATHEAPSMIDKSTGLEAFQKSWIELIVENLQTTTALFNERICE